MKIDIVTTRRLMQVLLAIVLGLSFAQSAKAYSGSYVSGRGITGTPHDLGTAHNGMNYTGSPSDGLQRVCIYCHAPHNTYKASSASGGPAAGVGAGPRASDSFDYLPLWNHELTAKVNSYAMYQSTSGGPQTGGRASQAATRTMAPGAQSLLCLSCHDGSVAINSFGNGSQLSQSRSGGGVTISPAYAIGMNNDLGNHHPIGFDYDEVQAADPEIRPADTATLGGAGTVRDHLFGSGSNRMECGTCHAVHNKGNTGEAMLWRSDVDSRLCLTCHDKGTNPGVATP